jgi:hypothetical protein
MMISIPGSLLCRLVHKHLRRREAMAALLVFLLMTFEEGDYTHRIQNNIQMLKKKIGYKF